jgi:RasGEF N-terminal motif
MSGTPSKMLEHLLDTRLNVQVGPNDDPFLDDFLLTHIVFMPIAQLVDELASHYHNDSEIRNGAESPEDYEYLLTCKKRVVHFIQRWVMAVRHAVFEDSAAAHFIEVSNTFPFRLSSVGVYAIRTKEWMRESNYMLAAILSFLRFPQIYSMMCILLLILPHTRLNRLCGIKEQAKYESKEKCLLSSCR